ncbi:hypothetical protein CYLTODRAFT_134685 [Cylindrobasidium torrendii FP15055 ss-10]|uniref:Uncharacterized protein n=1 Tax=Cylindrobasidium torrendii FP15055 ss-10 TaxID=1314674 RepID=A0A0D7BME0_9AGAR|nr:hypothetical protein CYLTODRAFT_134685 [Cylindrobasidium torrendii FP15055 ss-10]
MGEMSKRETETQNVANVQSPDPWAITKSPPIMPKTLSVSFGPAWTFLPPLTGTSESASLSLRLPVCSPASAPSSFQKLNAHIPPSKKY